MTAKRKKGKQRAKPAKPKRRKAARAKRARLPGRPRCLAAKATRQIVLRELSDHATLIEAAAAVGTTYRTLASEIDRDPEFAEAVEAAKRLGRSRVRSAVFDAIRLDPKKLTEEQIISRSRLALALAQKLPELKDEFSGDQPPLPPPSPPNVTHNNTLTIVNLGEQRDRLAALAAKLGLGSLVDAAPGGAASGHRLPDEPEANGAGGIAEPGTNGNGKHHGNGHA